VGREVIGKVTEQGNEGVILGVIDETATNGEKVFDEALNTWKDIKK
jgi:hypothetical protein